MKISDILGQKITVRAITQKIHYTKNLYNKYQNI